MLGKHYDTSIEEKWQKKWEEEGVYRFNEKDEKRPLYTIDTPPPFTSGKLHMGHVLSYSYFDFVARYKRMRGYNVYYPQGWDTQGFPTEVKVEKKYGRLPAELFRQKCVEWTEEFIAKMKDQMIKLGFSPDWRYEYRTMDPEYHKKVQYSLIEMYKKGMIYRAEHPVLWCPACHSAIAKAETEEHERDTKLNYIIFETEDGKKLEIATTRPELLHACVAVMFNPKDERYTWLEGKKVITPLGAEVRAIADEDVDKEFGTGLVMVCTYGDKMDVVWQARHGLPVIKAIDEVGRLVNAGEFTGLKTKEAREKIIEKLKKEGKFVKEEPLKQVVKVHDRCKGDVEFILSYQWFANVKENKEKIKEMAREIKWVPEFGIHYLFDWANSLEWDWVISRQRVFGTPIPFYVCENCGEIEPAGEEELPFSPEKAKEKKCKKCGGEMKPEKSTLDCWVDSSITPLVIANWPNPGWQRFYPSSLRPQGVEIIRTWAFYTIYRSGVALTGKKPWETILLNGNVLAPDGKKMSKSLGNVIEPTDLMREYPADAIRQWAAMSGAMAKDRPFSYEDIKYAKLFLNKLWNASRFIETALSDYDGSKKPLREIDVWIISRMNEVITQVTEAMENFEFHVAIKAIQMFFWYEVCDFYLEYVKHRIYGKDEESKRAAQYTLDYVLYSTIKLLAPFTPHASEEIYNEVFKAREGKSIHLTTWPETNGIFNESAIERASALNQIVAKIRQHKAANQMPMNAEIKKAVVFSPVELGEMVEDLKGVAKIKEVEIREGKEPDVELEF